MPSPHATTRRNASRLVDFHALYRERMRLVADDLRRQVARSAIESMRPSNRLSVGDFLTALQQDPEVWDAVASLGLMDFAGSVTGRRRSWPGLVPAKRSRLTATQTASLKSAIVAVLMRHADGLVRRQIAQSFDEKAMKRLRLDRSTLPRKLRQPMAQLLAERKIHTVGQKRGARYFAGSAPYCQKQ